MEPSAPLITEISPTETLVVFQTRSFATGTFEVELPSIALQRADQSLTEGVAATAEACSVSSVLTDESEPRPLTGPDLLEGQQRTFTPLDRGRSSGSRRDSSWLASSAGDDGRRWRSARLPSPQRRCPSAPPSRWTTRSRRRNSADNWRQRSERVWQPSGRCPLRRSRRPRSVRRWLQREHRGVVALRTTRLLEACDRVQFGGEQPTQERLRGYLQLAEAIWSDGSNGAGP